MAAGTPAPAEETTAGKGGALGNKIVLALSAVNLLVTAGMLGVLVISFQRDKQRPSVEDMSAHPQVEAEGEKGKEKGEGGGEGKEAAPKKKDLTFGRMVTLEQFTVNLSTPGSVSAKFVRVNISLEVPTEDTETEVSSKMPQVRNAIIDLFNSKRPADLANSEGREFLKDEIKNALNSFLISGKVKGVFFTSFALAG